MIHESRSHIPKFVANPCIVINFRPIRWELVKKSMKTTYGTQTKPMSQHERMPPKREIIAANIFLLQHDMLYYISQYHCSTAILLLIATANGESTVVVKNGIMSMSKLKIEQMKKGKNVREYNPTQYSMKRNYNLACGATICWCLHDKFCAK